MNEVSEPADEDEISDLENTAADAGTAPQTSDDQPLIEARNVSVVFDDQVGSAGY